MDTTPLGYPYPEIADAIRDYPAVAQSLAEMLDDERTVEGTTIAAIAAAVGGAAKGKRAVLRAANGDRMALVYDSVLGKWVGPERSLKIVTLPDAFSGSGVAAGAALNVDPAARGPLLSGLWRDCGLDLQARWSARVGITLTGATTGRYFVGRFYGFHDGAPNPYVNGAAYAQVASGGDSANPVFVSSPWVSMGLASTWTYLLPSGYFYATGSGTYSYYVSNFETTTRWVSV